MNGAEPRDPADPIVSPDFDVPSGRESDLFLLEPLGPEHNVSDLAAWSSSIEHIRRTPGFAGRDWPQRPLTLEENEADLVAHAADYKARIGFTYTVLDPLTRMVIGCVYIYPPRRPGYDVDVCSWVTAERAELDKTLYRLVASWIVEAWPFTAPDYAPR